MQRDAPPGFIVPDLDAPLDLEAAIRALPPGIRIRGMFMHSVVAHARAAGHDPGAGHEFIPFKLYDIGEHLRLMQRVGASIYPAMPLRRTIWRLAQDSYEAILNSLAGRVMFGVLGKDIQRISRHVGKAFELSGEGVSATLLDLGDDWSHIRIEGAGALVQIYHVGAFQGVLSLCGLDGEVMVKRDDVNGELFTRWRPAKGQ